MAFKARRELLLNHPKLGVDEDALESGFHTGLNWGIMSQAHSMSAGHVDTAGVFTAISVLSGHKIWAVRRTLLSPEVDEEGNEAEREIDVNDVEYFVDLTERDFASLPGGSAAWAIIVLFPGDVLYVSNAQAQTVHLPMYICSIIPPNARHAVYTISPSMMAGIHLYSHTQLQRSVCGWICALFSTSRISNAEHDNFLSILQAFASFWWPAFKTRHDLDPEHPST